MGQISLRPELVTSGGEACGIMLDDQYVGSLTLLYREEDRLWGTVQLDEEVLHGDEKEEIDLFIHRYVENMIDALGVPECFVTVTYSEYDHIVSTDNVGEVEEIVEVESVDYAEDDSFDTLDTLDAVDDDEDEDDLSLYDSDFDVESDEDYQLNIVGESRNKVEYQLLNKNNDLIAEALLSIHRGDVTGSVYWAYDPSDEEIDEVAQILVADYNSDYVDTFSFEMYANDELISTIELTHEDFLDDGAMDVLDDDIEVNYVAELDLDVDEYEEENYIDTADFDDEDEDDCYDDDEDIYVDVYEDSDVQLHFEMIRDDIDSITFDIYEEEGRRSSRIGTVTLDLEGKEITGLIDFINPRDAALREQVAYQLIEELDKETDYESFTVTMKYQDEVIDELAFDVNEQPNEFY